MHRTEGANADVIGGKNYFTDGPPGTTVEQDFLNALQEELADIIEGAGLTLKTASTETSDQLQASVRIVAQEEAQTPDSTITMPTGHGINFSADSRGTFKGITCITYRLTAATSNIAGATLSAFGSGLWEIADDTGDATTAIEAHLGVSTAVSVNGGFFTFGSTGYWEISFNANVNNLPDSELFIDLSVDSGATYPYVLSRCNVYSAAQINVSYQLYTQIKILNATVTRLKIRQLANGGNNAVFFGNTDYNYSWITFRKLADL